MPLEKAGAFAGEAGPSMLPPRPSRVEKAIEKLSKAYVPDADVVLSHEQLEEQRLYVLDQAEKVAAAQRELDKTLRDYHTAHVLTLISRLPSRIGDVQIGREHV